MEISVQTEYLAKRFEEKLGAKVLFALIVTKINNGTAFKDRNSMKKKTFMLRKKDENMEVCTETIKSQQLVVKRVLEKILAKILAEMHGIELRLMLQMRHNIDTRQKQRLRYIMVRHKQIMANLIEHKVLDFDNIDIPIRALEGRTIRKLIMNLEEKEEDKISIAIEYLQ